MRKQDFDNLVASIRQGGKIRRGEMPARRVTEFAAVDVKAIRQRLGKSQTELARMIGVSVATLQNWEQGRRRPEGPAHALLKVAAENPDKSRVLVLTNSNNAERQVHCKLGQQVLRAALPSDSITSFVW